MPTLLIRGDYAHKVQAAFAEALSRSVSRIRVVKVSNAAHFPHIENPGETNSAISEFLSKQGM
jgi:pimeloyl-ACP methyl ester carboxylesterase